MTYKDIAFDPRGSVAWITLNRPTEMNSISPAMVDELIDVLAQVAATVELRALVITGAGDRAFCAGADLKAVRAWLDGPMPIGEADFLDRLTTLFAALRAIPKPVIAAVNGFALAGGLEIVMACDLVIAADTATLGDAHSNFGMFPGAGGAAALPRKIGLNRAKYLLFTGDFVSAAEMKTFGLVNEVVIATELASAAQRLAERLVAKSPLVLRKMKEIANRALDQTEAAALRDEMLALRDYLRSADVREGLAAFADKRNPVFRER
jgi:enoyl-CoA hydratase